ncbi:MAG: hypothetical protein AAGH67_14905 [Cyanobacteria bacterium P01_H01_bin.162]
MSLRDITEQVVQLSVRDRLALVNLIVQSLQGELNEHLSSDSQHDLSLKSSLATSALSNLQLDKTAVLSQMRGLLKTERPAPTDVEVQTLLAERRAEKYLQ